MNSEKSIIVIEDDLDDQDLLKEVFEELKLGKLVHFFDSCLYALDYLLHSFEKPFLIISDINLPALTGLEFLKKINECEQLKHKCIPFVFLSTANDRNVIAQAYKMFCQGFFVKPLTIKELTQTVKIIIDYWSVCRRPNSFSDLAISM